MSYTLTGLPREVFAHLFAMNDAELATVGAQRVIADADRGFPCRVSLADARAGERLILLNYVSHDVPGPFRTAYAIYVRESCERAGRFVDVLPEVLTSRVLSLRGFASDGLIVTAVLAADGEGDAAVRRLFEDPHVAYIMAHFAAYGCFAARIERRDPATGGAQDGGAA